MTVLILVGWIPWISGYSGGGFRKDTVSIIEGVDLTRFSDNLDSLMNLWYVQTTLAMDSTFWIENYENDTLPAQYPDSVYIDRLNSLPTIIPLSFNRIVRNFIHMYTQKRRGQVEYMLGLSQYYFPMFEEILESYQLPIELKYMAVIESALNPRAISRVGATGMWQFMYGTGRMYGLTINSLVDERRDPFKSTYSAARYLKDLYRIYNDWILVIAAYNCGPGNVNKAIRRTGGKTNYWEIYYYLPRETRGYVPAYIAAAYAMNYYMHHNLVPKPIEIPLTTDTLMIHDNLHLRQVSEVLDIPIQELRDLNPQYRMDIIPGKSKTYSLRMPLEKTSAFIDYQDSIFAYKDSVYLAPGNMISNPTRTAYVHQPPAGMEKLYYTVKSGDNLGFIAEWYHVGLSQLRYWNGISRNLIRTGQKLVVYVPPSRVEEFKKIDSMSFEEKQRSIGKSVTASISSSPQPVPQDASYVYYKVRNGDSIWEIARKYPGVSEQDILRLNNMSGRDKIHPGQELKIMVKE